MIWPILPGARSFLNYGTVSVCLEMPREIGLWDQSSVAYLRWDVLRFGLAAGSPRQGYAGLTGALSGMNRSPMTRTSLEAIFQWMLGRAIHLLARVRNRQHGVRYIEASCAEDEPSRLPETSCFFLISHCFIFQFYL
jgi:hypothetical protein